MAKKFFNKKAKGFTLLETIIAITVMTSALLGAISTILGILNLSYFDSNKLIAAYLAQEGMEIVRNVRDSNWLAIRKGGTNSWNDNLTSCSSGCEIDYNDSFFNPYNENHYLRIDSGGFYNYETGTETKFKRKITIDASVNNELSVMVEVFWSQKGKDYTFKAQEKLYNWLP